MSVAEARPGRRGALDQQAVPFEGYAAIFGQADLTGDVLRPGAFSQGKTQRGNLILTHPSRVMMLYQHKAENPIGQWDRIREDENGLFVMGRIFIDTVVGGEVYRLVRRGIVDGLSIGFKARRSQRRKGGGATSSPSIFGKFHS